MRSWQLATLTTVWGRGLFGKLLSELTLIGQLALHLGCDHKQTNKQPPATSRCCYSVQFKYICLDKWLLIVGLCMATLTEVLPCFFLSCKANARVKPAKRGHGPHSS